MLSNSDLMRLKAALEDLAAELEGTLAGSAEAARPVELDQPAMGRVSRIDAIAQQKMLEANRSAQRTRLQLVRSGLARMADGEYGDCAGCGESIDLARLLARPESNFCVGCQSVRERRS